MEEEELSHNYEH